MKVAVVGAGYWGRKHVQEYLALGCEVAVCDPDAASAALCTRMGAKRRTLAQILDDDDAGHVSVCAPNPLHFPLAMKAAARGKHLLVEKPLCQTPAQARKLVRAAGGKLMCGHVFRFNGAIRKISGMISRGSLGQIRQIKFTWHQTLDYVRDRNIVLDIGLHPIDIADLWMGGAAPARVSCVPGYFGQGYARGALLSYAARGVEVSADLSFAAPRRREALVLGSRRSVRVQCVTQEMEVFDGERGRRLKHEANNTIRDQLRYFTGRTRRAILAGDRAGGPTALRVLETACKVDGRRLVRPAR